MTPTVIQRLRAAIHNERIRPATNYSLPGETDAAIAAVEQELAAKDAEIAELRKRPTLEEIEQCGRAAFGTATRAYVQQKLRDLYAEKARAEAPK